MKGIFPKSSASDFGPDTHSGLIMEGDRHFCFTAKWQIENVRFWWLKEDKLPQALCSPAFNISHDPSFSLALKLNSSSSFGEYYIGLGLLKTDPDIFSHSFNFELSFLAADETPLESRSFCYELFRESIILRVKRNEVFEEKRDVFLPQDVLTVSCKIWFDEPFPNSRLYFARTRIGINKLLFHGALKAFSSLGPGDKKSVTVKSALAKKLMYFVNIYLTTDRKIFIEGTPRIEMPYNPYFKLPQQFETLCVCKFSFLDSSECWIDCGQATGIWETCKAWKFPLTITREKLMANKDQYLPDDTLTLQCEVTFSTGIEFQNIEKIEHGSNFSQDVQKITSSFKNAVVFNDGEELETPPTFKGELMSLYKSGVLCDTKLRTNTQTFSAHKLILSARSPVFRATFTHDMKENMNGCVDIEDLDSDTVRRMLEFMYTDSLEDLEWENAKNLYFAADKYQILSLRQKCSNFMKNNINPCNCSDVLLLSELHNDPDLKRIAQEYILKHDKDIFASEEWSYFMENHLQISAETMRLRYVTK
ncbi:Speckle-type POZ protein-like B [Araneus ventricosus]|uniref:Speckle-type POZ protein-like B n=1 Tax=Araneus ventricosus TaxID=182803 RepID=A0A4Y2C3V2_ARAVE|nr:Speckle-type POZ protein-like B [Araneus ventricosus]